MEISYQVKLNGFEGPLDLLLHLINQYEIDIYDIPVSQITEQYMNYIKTMRILELNLASEYLVMAASLLAMKSNILLPNQSIEVEDEEMEEDPRDDLMKRLVEYRKYKEAAATLKDRELEMNQVYTRAPADFVDQREQQSVPGDFSIFDMVAAMNKVMERKKWDKPLDKKVEKSDIPINTRMNEVLSQIRHVKKGVLFQELFTHHSRSHMVVTFMAVLELMKENQIRCKQEKHFDDLRVYYLEGKS